MEKDALSTGITAITAHTIRIVFSQFFFFLLSKKNATTPEIPNKGIYAVKELNAGVMKKEKA